MKFNNFIWETFKSSEKGIKIIDAFVNLENNLITPNNRLYLKEIINSIELVHSTMDEIDLYIDNVFKIKKLLDESKQGDDFKIQSEKDACEFLECCWDENNDIWIQELFDINNIAAFSTALYLYNSDYYFPYLFIRQFYEIKNIFDEFGIFLPQVPPKKNQMERRKYYWELCKSIINFRKINGIGSKEVPAFLYGFAINVIIRYKLDNLSLKPKKAFFIGGGKKANGVDVSGDFDDLDEANETTIYNWQGNPDSQPGDIIVMYCLSPRSYIHSIWRAVTPGSVDPFFYFYQNVFIGNPIHVKHISWNEIKNDDLLAEMPLVKGNMQGINGRLIEKIYYDRILELLKQKQQDTSNIPKLENTEIEIVNLNNESDVELKLLEPLLLRLGYSKNDWQRQVKVKIGRTERIIPDYVIFPDLIKGNEKGHWIWEAKYSIPNHKQLKEDANQAKSYALRFQSQGFSLVAKEGLWISDKDMSIDQLKYFTWKQLESNDYFNELFDVVGKKKKM
jgi:hypothetical protein